MSNQVTRWWEVLRLRREVTAGAGSIDDVQMSLFRAVHGVAGEKAAYSDAAYYGDITHPSPNLVDLMSKVIVRLGGGQRYTAAPALWQLDQAMGGGKSHGLIGLWRRRAPGRDARHGCGQGGVHARRADSRRSGRQGSRSAPGRRPGV